MITTLLWLFWGSVATVFLVTFGYPAFLLLAAPLVRRRRIVAEIEPTVTLIIAAYNEESVIARKLDNTLELDYPRDKLEIIVASDGSSDRTDAIVQSYAARGIVLERFGRTGKTGVQNRVARRAHGEILVFSDANAFYKPDAIRKLVRNFADPEVGGVCGQLEYVVDGEGAGSSEGLYWRYERFLKRTESDLSSVVGANGSIYAVRRADYVQLNEELISDFVEPLAIVRNGRRFVYEPEAVSVEAASVHYGTEYRRKVRILTRAIRGLLHMKALLNPLRYGVFAFQLIVHKFLRFTTPVFLLIGIAALAGLATMGVYRYMFLAALVGAATAALVALKAPPGRNGPLMRACHLVYYYAMTNFALLLAWRNILVGEHMVLWSPERSQQP